MSTKTSIEAMIEDGMPVAQTSTNPYDVLAMEEDSVDIDEGKEDAEMAMENHFSRHRPASKRDDRLEDTSSPNHKSKKIQKGEALLAASEQAKDVHRYAAVEDMRGSDFKQTTKQEEIVPAMVSENHAEFHTKQNQGVEAYNCNDQEKTNSMMSDKGSKNPGSSL